MCLIILSSYFMEQTTVHSQSPGKGEAGNPSYWTQDAVSGFVVFLLALPLSLGIAKASDFPPITGLITAIIGGVVTSFIAGSRLTIKGPAAGLIVIIASAVADFGGGQTGWQYTLGAIVVAGLIQVIFGLAKMGKYADVFPQSAIHGMLAAIGIIIIAKQIPVLLDVDPSSAKGLGPIALIGKIPYFLYHLDPKATLIGIISLWVMTSWHSNRVPYLKLVPAPLVVIMIAVPAQLLMDFQHSEPPYALVDIGNLADAARINVRFDGIFQLGLFAKYVMMLALVGSLESMLTVRAIDMMKPSAKKSDTNKDLVAIGVGNMLAGTLGGLPMISEVARSVNNVVNGAKTQWANFFHGFFLFIFVLFAAQYIEMIPNTALAAMLITVGIKLAHPNEFVHIFQIGKEQLAIFLITIIVTLAEDLLLGILAGMVLKIIFHLANGMPFNSIFKTPVQVSFHADQYLITVEKSAVFTNWLGIKNKLDTIPKCMQVIIDLSNTTLVDHSVMENLHRFKADYAKDGGCVSIVGIHNHEPLSNHVHASRKRRKTIISKLE